MDNFIFTNTTKVYFGKDTQSKVGEATREFYDGNKVLVVYGSDRVKKNGLLDEVKTSYDKVGIEMVELGGVKPNPRLSLVKQGIDICRKENIGFVLAVGGASVMDTVKAIGVGVPDDGDVWDFFLNKRPITKTIKTACISTIPAAGSETSLSCVVTNEDGWYKKSINVDLIRHVFAIVNPELTYTLPKYQIGCGVTDMFTHVAERYFTNTKDCDVTDRMCEALMRSIIYNGVKTYENPTEYKYRAEIFWASIVAHNASLNVGREQDWASHRIGIEIGGMYDLAHGATLSIIMPNWMKYVYKHDIDRFVQFAVRVWDVDIAFKEKDEIVLEAISRFQEWLKKLGMPLTFEDANIPTDKLEEMASKCTFDDTIPVGHFVPIDKQKCLDIYKLALK